MKSVYAENQKQYLDALAEARTNGEVLLKAEKVNGGAILMEIGTHAEREARRPSLPMPPTDEAMAAS